MKLDTIFSSKESQLFFPIFEIKNKVTNETVYFIPPHTNISETLKKKVEAPNAKRVSQAIPFSENVEMMQNIIVSTLFEEIQEIYKREQIYLYGKTNKGDTIALQTMYYKSNGVSYVLEKVEPRFMEENTEFILQKMNSSHYPLYNLDLVVSNEGVITLYVDTYENSIKYIQDEDTKLKMKSLYFPFLSLTTNSKQREVEKNALLSLMKAKKEQFNQLYQSCKSINKEDVQYSMREKWGVPLMNNIIVHWGKNSPEGIVTKEQVVMEDLFKELKNSVQLTGNKEFTFVCGKFRSKNVVYRINKKFILNSPDNLHDFIEEGKQDAYYSMKNEYAEENKITKNKIMKMIVSMNTKLTRELQVFEDEHEYVTDSLKKNKNYIHLIYQFPKIDEFDIFYDKYVHIVIYPDASVQVKILETRNIMTTDDIWVQHIVPLVSHIQTQVYEVSKLAKVPNVHGNIVSVDTMRQLNVDKQTKAAIQKKLKYFSNYFYETPVKKTDLIELQYKKVPFFNDKETYLKFYKKIQSVSGNNVDEIRKLWNSIIHHFSKTKLELDEIFTNMTEILLQEGEKDISPFDREVKVDISLQTDQNTVAQVYITGAYNRYVIEEVYALLYIILNTPYEELEEVHTKPKENISIKNIPLPEPQIETQFVVEEKFEDDLFAEFEEDDLFAEFEEEEGAENNKAPVPDTQQISRQPTTTTTTPGQVDEISQEEKENEIKEIVLPFDKDAKKAKQKVSLYQTKIRNIIDPDLYVYEKTKVFDLYSRKCTAKDARQPILLTEDEMEHFKTLNREAYDKAYENLEVLYWGSSRNSRLYYLCSRIFCFRDKVVLTIDQLKKNKGKCPFCQGEIITEDAITSTQTVYIRKGKGQSYWGKKAQPDDLPDYLNDTGSGYPVFLDPNKHPKGLCMPCCMSEVSTKYNGLCMVENVDGIENVTKHKLQFVECTNKLQLCNLEKSSKKLIYDELKNKYNVGQKILLYTKIDVSRPIYTMVQYVELTEDSVVEVTEFTQLKTYLQDGMHFKSPLKEFRLETKQSKTLTFIKNIKDTKVSVAASYGPGKTVYINMKENVLPLGKDTLGRLFKNEDIFFENEVKDWNDVAHNKERTNLFLRKGIQQEIREKGRSFLYAISSYLEKTPEECISLILEKLTLSDFFDLSYGEVVQKFSPKWGFVLEHFKKLEPSIFQSFLEKYKTELIYYFGLDTYKTLTKKSNNDTKHIIEIAHTDFRVRRLLVVYYSFQFYKKHLGDFNLPLSMSDSIDVLSLPFLWENIHTINKEEHAHTDVHIVVFETLNNKMSFYCRRLNQSLTENSTILILSKRGEIFEPVVFEPASVAHKKIRFFRGNQLNLNQHQPVINVLHKIESIIKSCKKPFIQVEADIPQYTYKDLPNIFVLKKYSNITHILLDSNQKKIGVLTKEKIPIFLLGFTEKEYKKYGKVVELPPVMYVQDIPVLNIISVEDFQKQLTLVKNTYLKKSDKIEIQFKLVKDNAIIGFITNYGTPLYVNPIPITNNEFSDYPTISQELPHSMVSSSVVKNISSELFYMKEKDKLVDIQTPIQEEELIAFKEDLWEILKIQYNISKLIGKQKKIKEHMDTILSSKKITRNMKRRQLYDLIVEHIDNILENKSKLKIEDKLVINKDKLISPEHFIVSFIEKLLNQPFFRESIVQGTFLNPLFSEDNTNNNNIYVSSNDLPLTLDSLFREKNKPFMFNEGELDSIINKPVTISEEKMKIKKKKVVKTVDGKSCVFPALMAVYTTDSDKANNKKRQYHYEEFNECVEPISKRVIHNLKVQQGDKVCATYVYNDPKHRGAIGRARKEDLGICKK